MTSIAALKTINKVDPKSNFTKIDNQSIDTLYPGEKLSPWRIETYARRCKDTYIITAEGIAFHFNLINRYSKQNEVRNALLQVNGVLNMMIKAGVCNRCRRKNPKTGYNTEVYYIFDFTARYQIQKNLYLVKSPPSSDPKPPDKEKEIKSDTSGNTKKPVSVPYNKTNQKDNNRAGSNEPPVVVSFRIEKEASDLLNKIDPDKRGTVSKATIKDAIERYSAPEVDALIDQLNASTKPINDAGGYLGSAISAAKNETPWTIIIKSELKKQSYQEDLERIENYRQLEQQAKNRFNAEPEKKRYVIYNEKKYEIDNGFVRIENGTFPPGIVKQMLQDGRMVEVIE